MTNGEFILASGSPRRRQLLSSFGIPFGVVPPQVEEVPLAGEAPPDFVLRAAGDKGAEVARRCGDGVVLAADTVVSIDGRILGKPRDAAMARDMLGSLAGRVHSVYTAVHLIDSRGGRTFRDIDETRVWFRDLAPGEVDACLLGESVMDKAGAYAIQGAASRFIPRIEGNYSNVVGLPLPVVFDLIRRAGVLG